MKLFSSFLLSLLLLCCSCVGKQVYKTAPVEVTEKVFTRPAEGHVIASINFDEKSFSDSSVTGRGSSVRFGQGVKAQGVTIQQILQQVRVGQYAHFEKLARQEIRKLLLKEGNFRVFTNPNLRTNYTIRLGCSELVPDVKEADKEGKVPTASIATKIAAATPVIISTGATAIPLVGHALVLFEPLTGISLSRKQREVRSLIRFDVQVLSKNKEIVFSKDFAASFGVKVAEKNSLIGMSEKKTVMTSQVQDAIRVVASEVVKYLNTELSSS